MANSLQEINPPGSLGNGGQREFERWMMQAMNDLTAEVAEQKGKIEHLATKADLQSAITDHVKWSYKKILTTAGIVVGSITLTAGLISLIIKILFLPPGSG